jgi:prephenate dehydratase
MGLRRVCSAVRFLGSYPQARPASTSGATSGQDDKSDAEFIDAADWLARIRSGQH